MVLDHDMREKMDMISINELMNFIRSYRKKNGQCPECGSTRIWKNGYTDKLKTKYRCLNENCETYSFVENERGE